MHAIEGPQHRRLATPGRANEGRHSARLDDQVYRLDGVEGPVVNVEVFGLDALCHMQLTFMSLAHAAHVAAGDPTGNEVESHDQDDEGNSGSPHHRGIDAALGVSVSDDGRQRREVWC